jgi:hypothetical protein
MSFTYEQYNKAIVPLVLALGAFLVGWIDSGVLNRGELADVVEYAVVALLVFLVPNIKRERKPKPPSNKKAEHSNVAQSIRRRRSDDPR